MIVIQCLMVVMESGWHTVRMPSPMPAALFTSVLFSSTVPMKSRCVWSSACRVSASSGRTPRKRSVCSASESHSRSSCTAVRKSSAWQEHGAFFMDLRLSDYGKMWRKVWQLESSCAAAFLTCLSACCRRVCLVTDRAQTVSQRLLSSWSWTLTHAVSSRPVSIRSRAERFRAWTLLVLFPSSFWKACKWESYQSWVDIAHMFT